MSLKPKRESAVSSILKSRWGNNFTQDESNSKKYAISIATTDYDKNLAFQLGYEVYLKKGYSKENQNKTLKEDYDKESSTTVLLAKNKKGQAIATITLVFNRTSKLPCSHLFTCSRSNKNTAELTRLAISENYNGNFVLLAELLTWAFIYAESIEKTQQFLIEVNPRHQPFYTRVFHFEQLHTENKPCPRVEGAPAILLGLKFSKIGELKISHQKANNRFKIFKSIYQRNKDDIIMRINNTLHVCSS